jgi:acetyl-CoA carboxylase biotin carboxyl carrier protein
VTEAVRTLVELMEAHGLAKLDVTAGAVSIRMRAGRPPSATVSTAAVEAAPPPILTEEVVEGHVICAPMIGTYYAAPAPGEATFIRVGDRVEVGQTIGIIEAMKIMNEIPADRAGVVIEIMVANAQAVEYGSPLVRILPDGDGK